MHTSTTQPRNAGPEPLPSSSAPRPFGLRVRVSLDTTQRFLFGDDGPSLPTRLAEELCVLVARIVVSDFRIHSQLDRTVPAVLRNVRLGFWSCARRAALDAASALACGAKRRVLQPCMAIEAANLALRLAGLCETRSVPFGSNASKSKTTVGLSALSSRRCIASDASKKLVVVPKPRSPANER